MAVINGTPNGEKLVGGFPPDQVNSFGGNDTIFGRLGDDQILGGADHD